VRGRRNSLSGLLKCIANLLSLRNRSSLRRFQVLLRFGKDLGAIFARCLAFQLAHRRLSGIQVYRMSRKCALLTDAETTHENYRMNTKWKLVLATLAGISIGVGGEIAIRGQQVKPAPGYVVAEVDIHDLTAFQRYGAKVPETLAPFNHQYLVRSNKIQPLEGDPPKGAIVVIQFDSAQKARDWYDSSAYAAIRPIRQDSSTSRIYIVEGLPSQ